MATSEKRRILIVDDDEDSRAIISSCVGLDGHEAILAVDGIEAQQYFAERKPDLVLLDVMMPRMMGPEVCRWIRQQPEGPYTPVMMLTARSELRDKVEALEGGADDYLTKPFHFEELQARIKALLRVRDLLWELRKKNNALAALQAQLVAKERQLAVHQLAGTAAHQLGQPLSALMLNCHLLDVLPATDDGFKKALTSVKSDIKRMADLVQRLKDADASKGEVYHSSASILSVPSNDSDEE